MFEMQPGTSLHFEQGGRSVQRQSKGPKHSYIASSRTVPLALVPDVARIPSFTTCSTLLCDRWRHAHINARIEKSARVFCVNQGQKSLMFGDVSVHRNNQKARAWGVLSCVKQLAASMVKQNMMPLSCLDVVNGIFIAVPLHLCAKLFLMRSMPRNMF